MVRMVPLVKIKVKGAMAKVAATTFFVGKVIQSSFEQATPADSIYFWGHFSFFKHMASYQDPIASST